MAAFLKTTGFIILFATLTAILLAFVIPGCTQNQDNSPIAITNSEGRRALSVACSTDGSVAYLTDGRNVYRYDQTATADRWRCILSYTQRLEMAHQHDPREEAPTPAPQ